MIHTSFNTKKQLFVNFSIFALMYVFGTLMQNELMAQSLFVEQASSTVKVKQDNLVHAKEEALAEAKKLVIRQALSRFLENESLKFLEPLLEQQFINRSDVFIESTRIIAEGNTEDLKEFNLILEARIYSSRLLAVFRKLGLSPQSENTTYQRVYLIYNSDNLLRKRSNFNFMVEQLKARFKPYQIKLVIIPVKDKNILRLSQGIKPRLALLSSSKKKQSENKKTAIVELKIENNPVSETNKKASLKTELIFWSQNVEVGEKARYATRYAMSQKYTEWQPEKIIPDLLDRYLLKWSPLIQRIKVMAQGEKSEIKIKVSGLQGPKEEQIFLKTMFQNKPNWKNIRLDTISREFVVYRTIFSGKREKLLKSFKPPTDAPFRFNSIGWEEPYLKINVEWNEVASILEPYIVQLGGGQQLDSASGQIVPEPFFQVPLTPIKKTYILPFATPVFDHLRHRGDSTLFKVTVSANFQDLNLERKVTLSWYRKGVTNLKPSFRLYDENKKRISFITINKEKIYRFQYQLPEMQQSFYIRVADETGYLEGLSGSYQSFRYIIVIE